MAPAPRKVDEFVFDLRRMQEVIGSEVGHVVVTDEDLQKAVHKVVGIFPDVDKDYVRRLCAHFQVDDVVQYLMEACPTDIPRRPLPKARNEEVERIDDSTDEAAVATGAPSLPGDKKDSYQRLRRFFASPREQKSSQKTDTLPKDNFKEKALSLMIPDLPMKTVKTALKFFNNQFAPAYTALYAITNGVKEEAFGGWAPSALMRKKLKRARKDELDNLQNDPHFPTSLREAIDLVIRVRDGAAEEDEGVERAECLVCFDPFPITKMITCFPTKEPDVKTKQEHCFCTECVMHQGELAALGETVLAGLIGLPCMVPTCQHVLIWEDVRVKLPEQLRKRLSKRFQEANIVAAGLTNIESCKQCGNTVQMDEPTEVNKVFACRRCGAEHCRLCQQKWDAIHFGRKCNELSAYALQQYREKMTEAVIRKCPRCGVVFAKNGGCNLMTCSSCGMKTCFLCREQSVGYAHFCLHSNYRGVCPENCEKKCLLFASSHAAIDREVNRIKAEARQDPRIADLVSPDWRLAESAPRQR